MVKQHVVCGKTTRRFVTEKRYILQRSKPKKEESMRKFTKKHTHTFLKCKPMMYSLKLSHNLQSTITTFSSYQRFFCHFSLDCWKEKRAFFLTNVQNTDNHLFFNNLRMIV